jgi:4-carboxymuconolactone decarboxylase
VTTAESAATIRLIPLPLSRWTGESRQLMRGRLPRADQYFSGLPDAPALPGILGLFGHRPELAAAWLEFNAVLLDAPTIDPRDRELVILRVAGRTRSAYEWTQHLRIGAAVGLSQEQLAAIAHPAADLWTTRQRALLLAADDMVRSQRISDETWSVLALDFDEPQLLELLFVIGAYTCLAMVLNSAGLPPDDDTISVDFPVMED